jgi:hypothetical protein
LENMDLSRLGQCRNMRIWRRTMTDAAVPDIHYREAPPPEATTALPVDVQVTLEACPACGGSLKEERVDFTYQTGLPECFRPQVTQYCVWVCRCTVCGHQVRGRHPDLAPEQAGATAHRVGARVMATAYALHYGIGIPVRQVR